MVDRLSKICLKKNYLLNKPLRNRISVQKDDSTVKTGVLIAHIIMILNYKNILLFLALTILTQCNYPQTKSNCNELSSTFVSYAYAQTQIENASFLIHETTNTFRSSWIKDLQFYSCDGITGFLILKAKGKVYIHQNVPIAIWNQLRSANSLGSYYSSHIRYKYKLRIN